nr:MAG TPA: hypothetical protein [Caudoviricetes sp.]
MNQINSTILSSTRLLSPLTRDKKKKPLIQNGEGLYIRKFIHENQLPSEAYTIY